MKCSLLSPSISSRICSSRAVPKVATAKDCVSPRVKIAEPCGRGSTSISQVIGRISSKPRPSTRRPLYKIPFLRILYCISSNKALNNFFWISSSNCSAYFSAISALTFAIESWRIALVASKQAFSSKGIASASIASLFSRVTVKGARGSFSLPASFLSSSWRWHICVINSWAFSKAPSINSSETSWAPPSTIVKPSAVPATTISSWPFSICS